MIAKSISELIEDAHQKMAAEREAQNEAPTITPFKSAMDQIAAYKKWYCKRNQPNNYIRITQIIPPGFEENPNFWRQKVQVWGKKMIDECLIDDKTFDYIRSLPGWVQSDTNTMSSSIWRNPLCQPKPV